MGRLTRSVRGLILAACVLGTGAMATVAARPTAAVENLTAWSSWSTPATDNSLRNLFAIYNSEHPNVHWTLISGCNIDETKVLASVIAGNPPDMAFLGTVDLIGSWGARGALVQLDPLIKRDHFDMSQFTYGSLVSVQSQGRQYALPFFEDTYMMYYNKDDFKAAGLDPNKPPQTISQLEADAAKLFVKDSKGNYVRMGFVPQPFRTIPADLWGGRFVSADGRHLTATDPGIVASTQWIADYWQKYGPSKIDAATVDTSNDPRNDFINNRVAIFWGGEYYLAQILQDKPNLNFGVAPIPYLDGKPQFANSGTLGGNPLVIPRGSRDVNAAWDLLKWMSTKGSITTLNDPKKYYVADMDAVPALKSQVLNPKLAAGAFPDKMAQFWQYSASPNIKPWPASLVSLELRTEYYREVGLVEHGKVSAAKAMADLQAKVQPDLDAALTNLGR